jgi:hypothetical protein
VGAPATTPTALDDVATGLPTDAARRGLTATYEVVSSAGGPTRSPRISKKWFDTRRSRY